MSLSNMFILGSLKLILWLAFVLVHMCYRCLMGNNITCGEQLNVEPEVLIPVEEEISQKEKEKSKPTALQLLTSPPQITEQLAQAITCQKPFQTHHQHNRQTHIFKLNQMHVYSGEIDENNHPHGLGRIYRENGTVQIGLFQHSQAIGQHYLFMPDGSFYLGVIDHDTIPQGHYKAKDFAYNGQFREYEFHGKGRQHHKDYDFEGDYEDGERVQGVLKWKENNFTNVYKGRFNIFGEFQGEAKLLTREGIYKGPFRNGLKEGYGVFQYSNGLTYEGNYSNGQRAGKGRIINSNQSICYEGEFQDGLPHGWGKSCDEQGNIWEGQFKYGIAAGFYDSLPQASL